jgi:hypothetical protein
VHSIVKVIEEAQRKEVGEAKAIFKSNEKLDASVVCIVVGDSNETLVSKY